MYIVGISVVSDLGIEYVATYATETSTVNLKLIHSQAPHPPTQYVLDQLS